MNRVLGSLLLASTAFAAACGLVTSFEPLEYPEEQDGSVDATLGGEDAQPLIDARRDDATADAALDAGADADVDAYGGFDANVSCYERLDGSFDGQILFCDSFERDSGVSNGWAQLVAVNGGAVDISQQDATWGTRSMLVTIPSGASGGEKSAYLRTNTVSVTPLVFEADFKVVAGPPPSVNYPTNAFTLGRFTSGAYKDAFVRVETIGAFDPFFYVSDTPASFSQGAWCHLEWKVTGTGTNAQSITVSDKNGAKGTSVTRFADVPTVPENFWIGALTGTNLGPVTLLVDEVVLHQ